MALFLGQLALGVLQGRLIPAGAGVKQGEAMQVGISTVGSWQSLSLVRAGSCVLSSHSHPCHSQHPLVVSLDHKLPGMDAT